jgi:peptidyl-prolyl cis-trans isomerase SurA
MKKKCMVVMIAVCSIITASAQTLFTYGKYSADAKDFLRAFQKNNTQPATNKEKAINDYLDLYIKSRLKIREAYERGYDTLPQIKTEVANLRAQIADNYMNDEQMTNKLVNEAFERSLKDIHVGHIFITIRNANGVVDSATAKAKRDGILRLLERGEDFLTVAQQSSDDPTAKNNKGDLGYITVFTLPYEFENVIYATAPGKYSAPVTSKIGYHIFKNLGERKAAGKIKAQQILLALPPGANETDKKKLSGLVDSLYKKIISGEDFNKLAATFSNDYISAANSGIMPDISVGQYDAAFENILWSLPKDGAVSKPFTTSHGWHILKRISVSPIITDPANKTNQQELLQRIKADSRWKASDNFMYDKVAAKPGHQRKLYNDADLWAFTDSMIDKVPLAKTNTIVASTPLFSIGDSIYDAARWAEYAKNHRYKQDGTNAVVPYDQLREEYIKFALKNYYHDHLEDYNDEFRDQMTEFKDGNLFFEIMQQEIWNKAQADSTALMALYNKNQKSYTWNQSADAVIFFCSDKDIAKTVFDQLKKKPADWRKITEQYSEKVIADSSRYEWGQIPNLNKKAPPRAGMITTPLVNNNDNTASFAYIIKSYPQPMQRSFNEARGLVINDYQAVLEDQWTAELKKKYPVTIDQKVLSSISK